MLEKESLESLKIETSKFKERKPAYVKNVKINIYLDPKEKEKAKVNGKQVPVKIDVDKIRQQVFSPKSSYYLKVDGQDETMKTKGGENQKSVSQSTTLKGLQNVSRMRKNIYEHQMDYKPNSPDETTFSKRRIIEPLSPISS